MLKIPPDTLSASDKNYDSKKVSVIIPIYNVEQYIEKCLKSIINQTHKNLEILCINDCSTDNTLQIIKNIKDSRIKIYNNKKNSGPSYSRNKGIKTAKGEYIYFMDSDDWIDADYIESMIDKMEQTGSDIVINSNIMLETPNSSLKYEHCKSPKIENKDYISPKDAIENTLAVVWNKLVKREFIDKFKIKFSDKIIYMEDTCFHYISLVNADKIAFFEGKSYHYTNNKNGISNSCKYKDINILNFLNAIYDYYKENNLLDKGVKIFTVVPSICIKDYKIYNAYKKYFKKINEYLCAYKDLYNELELFFSKNIISSNNFKEYSEKYPANVTLSYIRNMNKRKKQR